MRSSHSGSTGMLTCMRHAGELASHVRQGSCSSHKDCIDGAEVGFYFGWEGRDVRIGNLRTASAAAAMEDG